MRCSCISALGTSIAHPAIRTAVGGMCAEFKLITPVLMCVFDFVGTNGLYCVIVQESTQLLSRLLPILGFAPH